MLEAPAAAMAAHNCGGRVLAEVQPVGYRQRMAKAGSLDPRQVGVPGVVVEAVDGPIAPALARTGKLRGSHDGGRTWGKKRGVAGAVGLPVLASGRGMTRNKPITLANGDILLPLHDEREWACLFAYSSDGEKSWGFSAPIRSQPGNIQPAAVQLPGGSLLALMRTGGKGGYIWRSHSFDAGRTWTPPRPTELPNPNSGIDLIRLPAPDQALVANGHLALAFNNTPRGRPPLNVALSLDEG